MATFKTINGVTPTGVTNSGNYIFNNPKGGEVEAYIAAVGRGPSETAQVEQQGYQQNLTNYSNIIAEQAAAQKRAALRQAWESNSQALNSQKATVTNNYNSATNKLNAVRDARLPEFQQQRNATSADAAQTAMRLKEIMAATGRGNSGYSRSNQTAVDLNRSNALSSLTGSENQFKTDVSNQLSDVDAQRVAALNDIASKLQLGEKQYNDGTLSLTNQLESEKASGALKAFLEAQDRADKLSQQSFDNKYKSDTLAQDVRLRELAQAFNDKKLALDQEALVWEQRFKEQGFTADESWRMAQLKLQQDTLAAETAYKNAALAKKSSDSSTKPPNTTTMGEAKDMLDAIRSGGNLPYIRSMIDQLGQTDPRIDENFLRTITNSIPMDNWQYLPGYK